jgi:hypothetical protein
MQRLAGCPKVLLPLAVLCAAACQTEPLEPALLEAYSATVQRASPGMTVRQAPRVLVSYATGGSASGVTVRFRATGGAIAVQSVVTQPNGIASSHEWTLRETPGEDTVIATVEGLPPIVFTATARPAVELARYDQTAIGDSRLPVRIGNTVLTGGELRFYDDGSYVKTTVTDRESRSLRSFYERRGQSLAFVWGRDDLWTDYGGAGAQIVGDRLRAEYRDPIDPWFEDYVKLSAAAGWP